MRYIYIYDWILDIYIYIIRYYKQPLSTDFYFDPFILLNWYYDVCLEWAYKFFVSNWFPSTFGPLPGPSSGGVYCKSTIKNFIYTGVPFFI